MADATPVQLALSAYVAAVQAEADAAAAKLVAVQAALDGALAALAESVPKASLAAAFTAWKAEEDTYPARFNTAAFLASEAPDHYGPRAANTLLSYIGP